MSPPSSITEPQLPAALPWPAARVPRALGRAIDIAVLALAGTSGWYGTRGWLDLRFAGRIVEIGLPLLWVASVLVLHALRNPPWGSVTHGEERLNEMQARVNVMRTLLWPTYLVLACIAANLVYFYRLVLADRIDVPPIPMGLLAGYLLVTWLWSAPEQRITRSPFPRWRWKETLWGAFCVGVLVWGTFFCKLYSPPRERADLAVVFGHRVLGDGGASVTLRDRTMAAVRLYRTGQVQAILLSGSIDATEGGWRSEVTAMKKVCLDAGVPEDALFLDPVGVNSRATVENTKRLLKHMGWQQVIAVSSDYHLPRIVRTYARAGITVDVAVAEPEEWVGALPFAVVREMVGTVVYEVFPKYRESKVSQMAIEQPRVVVTKSKNTLELFDGQRLVKTYACITGTHVGDKEREGDRKTPDGTFHICYKNPESKFHLSLGLDYPNAEDADRGLKAGRITQAEHDQIVVAVKAGGIPNWYTPLGGEIFIHGHGEGRADTAGCVAVGNREVEELYAICDVGTVVEIRP